MTRCIFTKDVVESLPKGVSKDCGESHDMNHGAKESRQCVCLVYVVFWYSRRSVFGTGMAIPFFSI